jgi:hypothetical protein
MPGQGARQFHDHQVLAGRRDLVVPGPFHPADITGELDHCVLESTTRAEEGDQSFAGAARRRDRIGLAPAGTAGQEPDAVKARQSAGAGHLLAADPVHVEDEALTLAQRVYQTGDAGSQCGP